MKQIRDRKIRVAWLSFWHPHAVTAPALSYPGPGVAEMVMARFSDLEFVAAWDEDPERGRAAAARIGLPFVEDLDELLARPDIDAVIVFTATSLKREVITKAAKAGKHISVTKVLSPTIKEAKEIVAAADAAGVVLLTQLDFLSLPYILRTKEIIDSGALGTIVNVRLGHWHGMAVGAFAGDGMGYLPDGHGFLRKEEACGGALADMCHPTYLTPYLLGRLPESAYARFGSASKRGDVEDNAVVIFDYPHGPYVTCEAGWATSPKTTVLEVRGTLGTVLCMDVDGDPKNSFFKARWRDQTVLSPVALGASGPSLIEQWIGHIRNGTRADENIALALDLARLTEAAYLSASQGRSVTLSSLVE
jgi:predicted dehydrogenase